MCRARLPAAVFLFISFLPWLQFAWICLSRVVRVYIRYPARVRHSDLVRQYRLSFLSERDRSRWIPICIALTIVTLVGVTAQPAICLKLLQLKFSRLA